MLSKFSKLTRSSENFEFDRRRTPFLGFPRTPFLPIIQVLGFIDSLTHPIHGVGDFLRKF
jgi:hypothetical protein